MESRGRALWEGYVDYGKVIFTVLDVVAVVGREALGAGRWDTRTSGAAVAWTTRVAVWREEGRSWRSQLWG